MEIGQEVEFKNDFGIETLVTGTKLQVKAGDKALVTKNGFKILTGEARGKINAFTRGKINAFNGGDHVEGYDHENISKLIYIRLNGVYGIEEYLNEYDIELKEFIEEIEDVLSDIL